MASFGFLFFLSTILVHLVLITAQADFVDQGCSNIGNYTTNSTYQMNLNFLMSTLSSNASLNDGFYNSTAGENPDKVYALFLCRGDVAPDVCANCVNASRYEIITRCPNQKKATIWYRDCMLRYSNQSMFRVMELIPIAHQPNPRDFSDVEQFNQVLGVLLKDLVTRASSSSSNKKFAIGEADVMNFQKLYGLTQCTPDISESDCNRCLEEAVTYIPECCSGKQGATILKGSCNLRYELYRFYDAPPPSRPIHSCLNTSEVSLDPLDLKYLQIFAFYCNLLLSFLVCRRGDVTSDTCRKCVNTTSHLIVQQCPNKKEANTWVDECMLRYSDRSIFAIMEQEPVLYIFNTLSISGAYQFNQVLGDLFERLTTQAAFGASSSKFATGEANFTEILKVYGLVQCTPDISQGDCNLCLRSALDFIPTCCYGSKGVRINRPSCTMRYELYSFYNLTASVPPVSPPPNSPAPPLTNTEITNGRFIKYHYFGF
ncbi:hypothetical protein HHK36_019516 [Tetracentron sinense]|uniref:Gnk2-homologous domain-containing protein n=1 Tax=Tetracentron sinense TaxID=13715 RepID=A0A835DA41_TETSI|nr:hypothetical protein HHK36_019516 [Tetracentron sinense]